MAIERVFSIPDGLNDRVVAEILGLLLLVTVICTPKSGHAVRFSFVIISN